MTTLITSESSMDILPYCFSLHYARVTDPKIKYLYEIFIRDRCNTTSLKAPQNTQHKLKLDLSTPLSDFPDELLRLIMEYLPWKSTVQSSMVCSEWKKLCNEEKLWESLCLSQYHIHRDSFMQSQSTPLSAREMFRKTHLQMIRVIKPSTSMTNVNLVLPISFQTYFVF
jgi:hypothetical protein